MTRLACLAALAAVVGCHAAPQSPTAPGTITPPPFSTFKSFAGVWTGEYRITETSGTGLRPGALAPFVLRLEQTGGQLRGHFQTDAGSNLISNAVLIDVSGSTDDDGMVSLQGSSPGLGHVDFVGGATLTTFRARIDPADGLAGDLEYRLERSVETRLGFTTTYRAEIVAARRIDTSLPSTFDGTWSGSFVVRGCTATCLPPHVNEIGYFRIELRQSGNRVTGRFGSSLDEPTLPISGRVEGQRLILDQSISDGRSRILEWSTERDAYGRMVGAFAYEDSRLIRRDVELGRVSVTPYPT